MATPAHFEQSAACHPAVLELVPPPVIPHQRDGGFLDESPSYSEATRQSVPGLGQISLQRSRFVQLENDTKPRLRRTMNIQLGSVTHSARITEREDFAVNGAQPLDTVVLLHGCSEMIDGGTGKNLHDALAPHFPQHRLISIATDGVGRYCQKVGWLEGLSKDFKQMAVDRHRLINVCKGSGRVALFDVSMGSLLTTELVNYNSLLATSPGGDRTIDPWIDIAAVVHHSAAQVPPHRVIPDMAIRFMPHLVRDLLRVNRQMAALTPGVLQTMLAYRRSLPAIAGNIKNLAKGIDPARVEAAAVLVRTGYLSGELDPLAQNGARMKLASQHPTKVIARVKPGAGHAECLNAAEVANDFARMYLLVTNLPEVIV